VPIAFPLDTMRGAVRRKAHRVLGRHLPAKADGASPCGAPQTSSRSLRKPDCYFAAISDRGPCFRVGTASACARVIRRISPPSSRPRPASAWQPLVVAADGSPRPPGRVRAKHIAQAPPLVPPHERPREAPLTNEVIGI
jgi:hypothetical protein